MNELKLSRSLVVCSYKEMRRGQSRMFCRDVGVNSQGTFRPAEGEWLRSCPPIHKEVRLVCEVCERERVSERGV